jgi:hypothetical protein
MKLPLPVDLLNLGAAAHVVRHNTHSSYLYLVSPIAAMAKQDVYHIHPSGWEGDPDEERFKVSTLDYLTVCTYNNYALFFRLEDVKKSRVAEVLIAGLERTLSQARHLCGIIEKDPEGGHSFVKKKDSTVRLFVQWQLPHVTSGRHPALECAADDIWRETRSSS